MPYLRPRNPEVVAAEIQRELAVDLRGDIHPLGSKKKHWQAIQRLRRLAVEEGYRFLPMSYRERKVFRVYLLVRDKSGVGYSAWNDVTMDDVSGVVPCIRQLYVRPDHRRQGIGLACRKRGSAERHPSDGRARAESAPARRRGR